MLNLWTQSYKLFLQVPCPLPISPTRDDNILLLVYSLHPEVPDFRKSPVIYLTNTASELWMFCAPQMWVTCRAQQNSCIIPQGGEGWRDGSTDWGSALNPFFALSSSFYLELSACSFLGWKAAAPKPVQKLWLFLSAFGPRHTFRLVLHISQIWSHHHPEDTSSHWGVQSSSMAEPDNERHLHSYCEGFPSLP